MFKQIYQEQDKSSCLFVHKEETTCSSLEHKQEHKQNLELYLVLELGKTVTFLGQEG